MLIDTHCHLTDAKITDVKKAIEEAKSAGVEKIFIPSTSIADSERAVIIAEQEEQYAFVGVHPENVDGVKDIDQMVRDLENLTGKSNRVIGIGEIGLDHYWAKERKTFEKQVEVFKAQMKLALLLKLPAVIHMRDAEEEMIRILHEMGELPKGQFHCFAGSESFLKSVIEKGFYVSFAGNITYKSAQGLRNLLKIVPLDKLLLETDSPYLAPEPVRGTVNSPRNVKIIATAIAKELVLDTQKIIELTGKNALCLYSLDT